MPIPFWLKQKELLKKLRWCNLIIDCEDSNWSELLLVQKSSIVSIVSIGVFWYRPSRYIYGNIWMFRQCNESRWRRVLIQIIKVIFFRPNQMKFDEPWDFNILHSRRVSLLLLFFIRTLSHLKSATAMDLSSERKMRTLIAIARDTSSQSVLSFSEDCIPHKNCILCKKFYRATFCISHFRPIPYTQCHHKILCGTFQERNT